MKDYFASEEETEAAESVIEVFHDDMLIDPSLKDTEKILLCTYMKANEHESNLIDKTEVGEMFENMGGDSDTFSKSVYDLVNRRDPTRLKEKNGKIGLTFHGRKKVKEIIEVDGDEQ